MPSPSIPSTPPIPTPRNPCSLPNPESTKSFWHSEPDPLLIGHRSTRNLPETADVVIIGSGITGTSIAHHLLESLESSSGGSDVESNAGRSDVDSNAVRRPLTVVMLEAREACWGATGRNGGHCQPILFAHPQDPSIGHFELQNFHTLASLIKERNIDCEFLIQPGVQATYDLQGLQNMTSALDILKTTAPELLQHMELITSPSKLADLRIPTAKAAIVTDLAAKLWPYKFVSHILVHLLSRTHRSSSSTFNLQTLTPVTSLSPYPSSNGEITQVHTPRGTILAKKVICATNAYTSHLLPQFSSLIVPVRGQMSCLKPFPSLSTPSNRLKTSLGFSSTGEEDYLIQRPTSSTGGGSLMFGGGRSHGGKTVGTTDDSIIDPETEEYLKGRLGNVLGLPEAGENMEAVGGMWTGIMGFSRDEKPWIGQVPGIEGSVFLAAGFTGHGMPNAWLCGRAAAEMCLGSLQGEKYRGSVEKVREKTGLPGSYVCSEERMRKAMEEWRDVEVVDCEEMEKGRSG